MLSLKAILPKNKETDSEIRFLPKNKLLAYKFKVARSSYLKITIVIKDALLRVCLLWTKFEKKT